MSEKKVCVNYDAVMRTLEFWANVNRHPLREIEWVRDNGDTIAVDDRLIDAWRFIGLVEAGQSSRPLKVSLHFAESPSIIQYLNQLRYRLWLRS